jgi:hypothetical protein
VCQTVEVRELPERATCGFLTGLLGGLSPTDTLIVWGNGGFGPTSKGHDSAPNQKLQKALSQHVPLVVGSEYRSSKTSCCHHCPVENVRWPNQRTRSSIVKCTACNRMLGRDVNAANIIADIFVDVRTLSDVLPLWITNDDVRKVNSQKLPGMMRGTIFKILPNIKTSETQKEYEKKKMNI